MSSTEVITQAMDDPSLTVGGWNTESESAEALDRILAELGLWKVFREVPGTYMHPRASQTPQNLRIDRLLVPKPALIQHGWRHGAIGIEIKRSGARIGPPLSQALDYSRALWPLPNSGINVWLDWVFLWPAQPQKGTVASLLAHQRIGTADTYKPGGLRLKAGEVTVFSYYPGQKYNIGDAPSGRKVGSR